ncbi:MAG: hypothetical protein HYT16_04635 [DPANN group archaeon]|nr:hypothetical protein [DPANN group archaeon]
MAKEIDILVVLKWIFLAVFILALIWFAFGHSPTLAQYFTLATTGLFFYLAIENRHGTFDIAKKLDKLDSMERALNEIRDILKERLK